MDATDPDVTGPAPDITAPVRDEPNTPPGGSIGRYLTLETLGRGGGGEVFAAFDPVLDRKVAIKLLHGTEEAKPALIREGRMLAKVVHSAVVEVYEVGFYEGQAFMAMELVGGGDLAGFATEQRANGRNGPIIGALLQVAEGIVAAHAAGVVHGDIKPSNVLRSEAGGFKVSDFGIATLQSAELAEGSQRPVGTPAFMAPEQHAGESADERTDQYSFCVTAWVALTGELPFSQDSLSRSTKNASLSATGPLDDLETLKQEGAPAWPTECRVEGRVVDALSRGLSPDAVDRWPSMAALLAELRPNFTRARLRRAAIGVAAGGAVVLGVLGYQALEHRGAVASCEAAAAEIDELWNDSVLTEVRSGLESSGVSYASATADRALPRLDEWAGRWAVARGETCGHHVVTESWDADLSARAAWCLEEQRLSFAAAVERLREPGASAVTGAVALATGLPRPEVCRDAGSLLRRPAPPSDAEHDVQVKALRELATARALDRTGNHEGGLEAVERVKVLLGPDSESSMLARVLEVEAKLRSHAGQYVESEAAGTQAYALAAAQEDWATATMAAEALIFVVGAQLDRPTEGAGWERHARIAGELAGDPLRLYETTRTANLAVVKRALGDYEASIALHERALELNAESLGADHPERATMFGNLAAAHMSNGNAGRALELFEQAVELRSTSLGPEHPSTISALANVGAGLAKTGQLKKAQAILTDVLSRRESSVGPMHPEVGRTLDNIGAIHNMLGESDAAVPLLERSLKLRRAIEPGTLAEALTLSHLAAAKSRLGDPGAAIELLTECVAIRERAQGREHPKVAEALVNLGTEYLLLEDLDRAEAMFLRAKGIYAEAVGTSHPGYAAAVNNLAEVALASGRPADAIPLFEEASVIWVKSLGPQHPSTATAKAQSAAAWLALGKAAKARPLLVEAVEAFAAGEGKHEQEVFARFDLAKALVAEGDARAAIDSANAARDVLSALGGGRSIDVEEIDAWLAANAPAE